MSKSRRNQFLYCLAFVFSFLFSAHAQSLSGQKWLLMSIDHLESGVKKEIGQYLRVELWFEGDTVYKGQFCNAYTGKFSLKPDFLCSMSAPQSGKRKCMGFSDTETELFRQFTLVNKYILKAEALFLFTSDKKRLVFRREPSESSH